MQNWERSILPFALLILHYFSSSLYPHDSSSVLGSLFHNNCCRSKAFVQVPFNLSVYNTQCTALSYRFKIVTTSAGPSLLKYAINCEGELVCRMKVSISGTSEVSARFLLRRSS